MDMETLVERIFTNLGFHVDRIVEVQDDKRADYRIADSNDSYVVEVKVKSDAESILEEYDHKLDDGDVFFRSESTAYNTSVSNVLDKAASQLSATAESENEFRIVWLELAGLDRKLQFQQTIATIYGAVQLLPIEPNPVAKDCYYFKHNVVHRRPEIDAFILSNGASVLLATNPFSPRSSALASTKLYSVFAQQEALVDPVALEHADKIYVADCEIPRRDTQAVLEYVQQKYAVERFLHFEPVCTTASVEVKRRRGN